MLFLITAAASQAMVPAYQFEGKVEEFTSQIDPYSNSIKYRRNESNEFSNDYKFEWAELDNKTGRYAGGIGVHSPNLNRHWETEDFPSDVIMSTERNLVEDSEQEAKERFNKLENIYHAQEKSKFFEKLP